MSQKNTTRKDNVLRYLKQNWLNLVFLGLVALVVFHPDAKAWVLRRLMAVGLFQADMPVQEKGRNAGPVALSFADEVGRVVHTANLKGKVVFVNFWAEWCPPCRAEMPSIDALYRRLKGDNRFVFLMVDVDGAFQKSEAYMRDKGFSLPVHAPAGPIPEAVFSGTLPTTVVLGPDGAVAFRHEGIANYHSEEFLAQLKKLLP